MLVSASTRVSPTHVRRKYLRVPFGTKPRCGVDILFVCYARGSPRNHRPHEGAKREASKRLRVPVIRRRAARVYRAPLAVQRVCTRSTGCRKGTAVEGERGRERDYPILSATVLASMWGTRLYGRTLPGDPDRLHLSLMPVYDPAAVFYAGLVLQGTYPCPVHAFLESCNVSKVSKSQWRSNTSRYGTLIKD